MKFNWTTGLLVGAVLAGCILKQSNPPPGPYGTPNGNTNGGGAQTSNGGQSPSTGGCTPDDTDANGNAQPRRACDASDGLPIGARIRGESVAFDGTKVCIGIGCAWDCPGGNCKFFCGTYGKCDITCGGGNCQTTCTDQAKCNLDCLGGSCKSVCTDRAECESACAGGKCSFKCEGNRCSDTCAGGDCT